jgi:KaiC/GvpD/RAD55 family RecA-like ATPase
VNEQEFLNSLDKETERRRRLEGYIPLGRRISEGVEPPATLTERTYAAKIHAINAEAGSGKTLYALWEALQVIRRKHHVMYLDNENGPNSISERLEDLGADPDTIDESFRYYRSPEVSLEQETLENLFAEVDHVQPSLVIFDSLPDFLAMCGLDENNAGDVTQFIVRVLQPLKDRGIATMILDHVTKSPESRGRYARGSGAKLGKVDVSYTLTQPVPFDRERVGELKLQLHKDRDAYLRTHHKFAVGGAPLLFVPDSSVIEEPGRDGLTDNARVALDTLREHYQEKGATHTQWLKASGLAKSTFKRARDLLVDNALVIHREDRYFPKGPDGSGGPKGGPKNEGPTQQELQTQKSWKTEGPPGPWTQSGPSGPGSFGSVGPPPFRGGPSGPKAHVRNEANREGGDEEERLVRMSLSALRDSPGPRKALEHHYEHATSFEFVVRATMTALDRGDEPVSEWKPIVLKALDRLDEGEDEEGVA